MVYNLAEETKRTKTIGQSGSNQGAEAGKGATVAPSTVPGI